MILTLISTLFWARERSTTRPTVLCSLSSPQGNFSKVVKVVHHFFITICAACDSGGMVISMKIASGVWRLAKNLGLFS